MLKEDEEQESEESNSDSNVNSKANKIDEDNNNMINSMEEEQNTLEYQETMKVDAENIAKNNNWRSIYEVINTSFLKKTFPPAFLDKCLKYPNEPQFLPYEVRVVL